MEDGVTLVVNGLSINNYVGTGAAGASEPTPTEDACAASPSRKGNDNVSQSDSVPMESFKAVLQESLKDMSIELCQELREIKKVQERQECNINLLYQDRQNDREKYEDLLNQHNELKEEMEEITQSLENLNEEKNEKSQNLESVQQELNEMLRHHQSCDVENLRSDIQNKEKEIESLKSRIRELEQIIESSNEKQKLNVAQVCEVKQKMEMLKEEKEKPEKGNSVRLNESGETKGRDDIVSVTKPDQKSEEKQTKKSNVIAGSPRPHRQSDTRKFRPGPKTYNTREDKYNTTRQQAFVGTKPPKVSHNIVFKKAGQKNTNDKTGCQ